MTEEVLAQGDDEQRRGSGQAIGVAVALLLLAVVGVAIVRSREPAPEARPTPPPSSPSDPDEVLPTFEPPPPPFQSYVSVPVNDTESFLLSDGTPVFLVPGDYDLPVAIAAVGGPEHAPVLVGWCARTQTFQDASGTYLYSRDGRPADEDDRELTFLPHHEVRVNPDNATMLDVDEATSAVDTFDLPPPARKCAAPVFPELPETVTDVHDTSPGYRVLRGRYVVTTETRRFCALGSHPRCLAGGWEDYGYGLLPDDLASTYVWDGRFLVHASAASGRLTAVRIDARLVARERVGVEVVYGFHVAAEVRGRGARLRVDVLQEDGLSGGVKRYDVRPDAEVYLGRGVTGIGFPRGTPETLVEHLLTDSGPPSRLVLVLDANGKVMRVVLD